MHFMFDVIQNKASQNKNVPSLRALPTSLLTLCIALILFYIRILLQESLIARIYGTCFQEDSRQAEFYETQVSTPAPNPTPFLLLRLLNSNSVPHDRATLRKLVNELYVSLQVNLKFSNRGYIPCCCHLTICHQMLLLCQLSNTWNSFLPRNMLQMICSF